MRIGPHHRRLDVAALGQRRIVRRPSAGQDLAALFAGDRAVVEDALLMLPRGQRPHLRRFGERIADPDRAGEREETVEEFIGDLLVQHQPRTRDASLALVVEDGEGGAVDRSDNVGVVEHDVRALAAEFELHLLEIAG